MPSLRLKISYNKNNGLLISPMELRETYLFGIPVCTTDGRKISQAALMQAIRSAQQKFERVFSIKLQKEVIEESKDFIREDFNHWGYVKSTYPIAYASKLQGFINEACQTDYPHEWLVIKRTENVATFRNLYLIPNSSSVHGAKMNATSLIYNGISPHLGWFGSRLIPNYWRMTYVTGWDADKIPDDLIDAINKLAAINAMAIIGTYLYGVGISSLNVSLDGVSQSIPLTKGGRYGLFSDRIQLYLDDLKEIWEGLKYEYSGIIWTVV